MKSPFTIFYRRYHFILILLFLGAVQISASKLSIEHLRCENKINPIGLDEKQPRFSWMIGMDTLRKGLMQTGWQIQVVAQNPDFENEKLMVWDSEKVRSDVNLYVAFQGEKLEAQTTYYWRVKIWDNFNRESNWSQPAAFETGLMDTAAWIAKWIAPTLKENPGTESPLPLLRKSFTLTDNVKRARLYITSQGLYRATINGQEVTDHLFTPGWTSFNKRSQYQVYDVTSLLKKGENATGVELGDGWFRGDFSFGKDWYIYGKKLALLYQLDIEYNNGEKQIVISDDSWKNKTGAVQAASIYNGVIYDANKEIEHWNTIACDDQSWIHVAEENIPKNHLVQNLGEAVRRIQILSVKKEIITPRNEKVYDFGQNLTGRVRFHLQGKKGDTITILHAEVLDKAGNFYTDNLRKAKQRVQYIFKDDKPVDFEPEFTFQGFRYIKILDYHGLVKADNFKAIVIHSDMLPIGEFTCSDSMVNQLHSNIRWGMRGNFLDIPTDCPQRNERLGWTGDVQAFSATSHFLFNTTSFYTKWLEDLKADQLTNGSVPHVVPASFKEYGSTGWGDVATVLPMNVYLASGDKKMLENQYSSMKLWVDFLTKQADKDWILRTNSKYGDWLFFIHPTDWNAKPGYTDKEFIGTAFFAHSTKLLAQAAAILGNQSDARHYQQQFISIRKAFQREFMSSKGRLSSNSQTAYTLALSFDLLPQNQRANALKYLVEDIQSRKNHLSTGFLGTPLLCHALSENGANETAYQLLLQKTYPSWLYPVTKGATTIWERWDGIKPDGSFQTTSMNSFNHYAYGAIGSWMYGKMAGFQCDLQHAGYKHIDLKPMPDPSVKWVNASIITPNGKLSSNWNFDGNQFKLEVIIPSNTTATIFLPLKKEKIEVGSGVYRFEYQISKSK